MQRYIAKRLLLFIPAVVLSSLLIFTLMRVVPGDVAMTILSGGGEAGVKPEALQALREQLGLNKPLYQQYLEWLGGFFTLHAGNSLWTREPVFAELGRRIPVTLELGLVVLAVSWAIALPTGILSALNQDTWVDYLFRVFTISGLAIPNFWLSLIIILVLVNFFNWSPPLGFARLTEDPIKNLQQLVWPILALGVSGAAITSRMTRSAMLEVLRQDYIRTAWAKGLRERVIISRHALKNALLPVVTIFGSQVGHILGGAVIIETIWGVPGMGSNYYHAIQVRDYPMVQTITLIVALAFLAVNLAVDLVYSWLDPRIRYT